MKTPRFLKTNQTLWLVFIIFVASCLRFYQLGSLPPSLTWDEVAWGYNAYALGLDGRDEFGRLLPVDYLESFGDFKPPVYAYLDILPVSLFGLNEFATRFPSAFFGVLTVFVSYFLTRRIFATSPFSRFYAFLTALLLAISPWHIMLSRGAFEANVATFFLATAVWLFLESMHKRYWLLVVSIVLFILAFYTFNTARIVGPLLVLLLTMLYWRKLFVMKKAVIAAILVGIFLLLPTVPFLLTPQAKLRFQEVNIFSDMNVIERSNQEIANDNNAWWSKVLHNRRFEYSLSYFSHYFDNLRFDFLFITGDGNPKFSTQSVGQLYLWELPFFIIGILFLLKRKEDNWKIVPLWLLIGIIPAAAARETPHALRIETTLPTFQIFVAYGMVTCFTLLKNLQSRKYIYKGIQLAVLCYLLMALFSVIYFVEDYYTHYAKRFSHEWQYGYKDAVLYANEVEDHYGAIYLTNSFGRPYIYALLYKQHDPTVFRKEAIVQREALGFVTVDSFGKYYFTKDLIPTDQLRNTLYIDIPKNVGSNANIKKKFYFLNGEVALIAYTL